VHRKPAVDEYMTIYSLRSFHQGMWSKYGLISLKLLLIWLPLCLLHVAFIRHRNVEGHILCLVE